jgi:hypothetical protein
MPSMAYIALDWMDAHPTATQSQRYDLYERIPAWQFDAHFAELCEKCPSRRDMGVERRPANALNVEIGSPMPRCIEQGPDGRGLTWLLSGGSLLAYGICGWRTCPRCHVPAPTGKAGGA